MSRLLLRATVGLALLCLLIAPLAVFAHEEVDAGNYTIEYGWVTEPPTAGQANALVINFGPKLGETTGTIKITSPADDSTVQGDKVEVTIAVEGFDDHDAEHMHWHLKLDEQTLSMSPISQTTVTVSGLSNGEHTIEAILAGEDHGEMGEPTHTKIIVEGSSATGSAMVMDAGEMVMGGGGEEISVDVSALTVEMVYAGETTPLTLKPVEGESGHYTADFTPARAGLYTLKISGKVSGSLGDSDVNVEVNPEEVSPGDTTAAPTTTASASDYTVWYVIGGLVIVAALAAAAFFLLRKK
jgi:hypothetical protein